MPLRVARQAAGGVGQRLREAVEDPEVDCCAALRAMRWMDSEHLRVSTMGFYRDYNGYNGFIGIYMGF